MAEWQKCPVCDGQGVVSRPPGFPGDAECWVSDGTCHTCRVCNGSGIINESKISELSRQHPESLAMKLSKYVHDHCTLILVYSCKATRMLRGVQIFSHRVSCGLGRDHRRVI